MAVETERLAKIVEQSNPKLAIIAAVITNIAKSCSISCGANPPKKKTRLKSGMAAAMSRSTLLKPAMNFPATREKEESCEQSSMSYVLSSFSALTALDVKDGVINMMSIICTVVSN